MSSKYKLIKIQVLSQDTLEPTHLLSLSDYNPEFKGHFSSHPKMDNQSKETIQLVIEFGYWKSTIKVICLPFRNEGMPLGKVLASIYSEPSIIHEFGLTSDYVVIVNSILMIASVSF